MLWGRLNLILKKISFILKKHGALLSFFNKTVYNTEFTHSNYRTERKIGFLNSVVIAKVHVFLFQLILKYPHQSGRFNGLFKCFFDTKTS
jgi:hypothetical protein